MVTKLLKDCENSIISACLLKGEELNDLNITTNKLNQFEIKVLTDTGMYLFKHS